MGKALAQNTALIAACRLATAVSALLVVPVVLGKLGVAGYGTWEAIAAVSSLSLMFQGAISATAIWQASTAFGAGRPEDVHRAARLGITATLIVFVLIVPPVWAWRESIVQFLNIGDVFQSAAYTILPMLIAIMVLGGIPESLAAIVTAQQRAGLASITSAAGLLGNYGVVMFALYHDYGLWSLLFGYATNLIVQSGTLFWLVSRISGPLRMLPVLPTKIELHTIGSYYGLILIGFVSAALRDQTDKIILASMASPLWVGYYAIASRLAGLVIEVNRFFYVPTVAAVASLNAAGDWTSIQKLFTRMMTAGALATGAVVVVVAAHYDRMLVLWLGQFPRGVVVLLLLLLVGNAAAVMLTGAGTALCRAVGKVGIETTYVVVNLIANVVLTVALVWAVGPVGTVIASAVTWAGSSVVFLVVMHRRLDLPMEGTMNAVRAIGAVIVTVALMRVLSLAMPLPSTRTAALVSLCWLGPVTLAAYAVAAHVTGAFTFLQLAETVRRLPRVFFVRDTRLASVRSGR